MSKNLNQDPGVWRQFDLSRPWYQKAINLLPDLSKQKIIELGSGQGELARIIKPLAKEITCVDDSPIYIRNLKGRGFKVIQADLNQRLPFQTSQFDGVVSLEVIEHLSNAGEFLKEINRILKPKGWLVISTPNIAWWGYRLFALIGQPPKKEGYHLRFFTHCTFSKYLATAGFKIVKTASFSTIPLVNRWLIFLGFKPVYPTVNFWPNLLSQDLVFLCLKK